MRRHQEWLTSGEWILLFALLIQVLVFSAIAPNFFTRANFFEVLRVSDRIDAGDRQRRHRSVRGRDDGTVCRRLWCGVARLAPRDCGGRAGRAGRRRRRGRPQCRAGLAPRASAVDRDARIAVALPGNRRGTDARGSELHGLPRIVPRIGAGVLLGRAAGAAADLHRGICRVYGPAAPLGARTCALRNRVFARGRALRGHTGPATRGSRVSLVGPDGQRCGSHLRRAHGPGAVRRGDGLRARRHYRGGAGRHVGVRGPRHALGHAVRTPGAQRAAQWPAARGVAVGACGRDDGHPAARDDRHRSCQDGRARGGGVRHGGTGREKQPGCGALRNHACRFVDCRRDERLAGAIAGLFVWAQRCGAGAAVWPDIRPGAPPTGDRDDAEGERGSLLHQLPRGRGRSRASGC